MSVIEEVWSLLDSGKARSVDAIAHKLSLPVELTGDILFFLAKYGFAQIEIGRSGATKIRLCEGAPPIPDALGIVEELTRFPGQTSTMIALNLR